MSKLADAQHEAAHIVVGVALGLRLHCASLSPDPTAPTTSLGWTQFYDGPREAAMVMVAAGLAWERRFGNLRHAADDIADLRREFRIRGNARIRVLERLAWAVLEGRTGVHSRVTRALLEQDLTAAGITLLIRGTSLHS